MTSRHQGYSWGGVLSVPPWEKPRKNAGAVFQSREIRTLYYSLEDPTRSSPCWLLLPTQDELRLYSLSSPGAGSHSIAPDWNVFSLWEVFPFSLHLDHSPHGSHYRPMLLGKWLRSHLSHTFLPRKVSKFLAVDLRMKNFYFSLGCRLHGSPDNAEPFWRPNCETECRWVKCRGSVSVSCYMKDTKEGSTCIAPDFS